MKKATLLLASFVDCDRILQPTSPTAMNNGHFLARVSLSVATQFSKDGLRMGSDIDGGLNTSRTVIRLAFAPRSMV